MLLGLDDTDTRQGGCTTHTALRTAVAIEHAGGILETWGLTAPARLVRLNPAAPHKTRGNGALVLPIGPRAPGDRRVVGRLGDDAITIGPPARTADSRGAIAAIAELVASELPPCGRDDADPQPGAVLLSRPPPAALYHAAVSRLVRPGDAWQHAPPGTTRLTAEPRRGEIGALAATAWPLEHWTWEAIAYRAPTDTSTPRVLPPDFARHVRHLAGGFDNIDEETGRVRAVPRTPCPVRWGIRGTDPQALLSLHQRLDPDAYWLVQTNHATGDHAIHAGKTPTSHGIVNGTFHVRGTPQRGVGGHLFVSATDDDGSPCTLAAYEPTKTLRAALDPARPGDTIHVVGRTAADSRVVAVEACTYVHAAPRRRKVANPRCATCGRSMKSAGAGAGYRCRPCGTNRGTADATTVTTPGPAIGVLHQVPDHVRGHLLPPRGGLPLIHDLATTATCSIAPILGHVPVDPPHPQTPRRPALL